MTRNLFPSDLTLTDPGGWLAGYGWEPELLDLHELLRVQGVPAHALPDKANDDPIGVWLLTGRR
jgi:hypothetical protein